VGGNVLCSTGPRLLNSVWNKEELPQPWKHFISCFQRWEMTAIIIKAYQCYSLYKNFIQ